MEDLQKFEDRLIAIENDIGGIYKALKKYSDIISRMQIYLFLQSENPEMMQIFKKLFADENAAKHLKSGNE